MIGTIVASWVISPVLGGVIAAMLLGFVKWAVIYRQDRLTAARRWVPVLVALMSGVFAMYLATKGLRRVWHPPLELVLLIGAAFFAIGWALAHPWVRRRSRGMENRRKHIASFFTLPLVFAAALLSFAHGANDVANAVGPLAAIVAAAEGGLADAARVALPFWVLAIGAVGIAVGLALFGPGLIRTVGEKITKMDTIRAYCVALSAAITVLVASALGLPVSSTHIAIGAVFGVGFLREVLSNTGVPNPAVAAAHVAAWSAAIEPHAGGGGAQLPEARAAPAGAAPACARYRGGLGDHGACGGPAGGTALLSHECDGRLTLGSGPAATSSRTVLNDWKERSDLAEPRCRPVPGWIAVVLPRAAMPSGDGVAPSPASRRVAGSTAADRDRPE